MTTSIARTFTFVACAVAGALACERAFAAEPEATADTSWVSPSLTYDGAVVSNARGGLRRGTTYVGNLHLKVTAKGEPAGWTGTTGFADLLTINGGRPGQRVGDAQGVNNIEGPSGTQIEELWLQHNFKDSGVSLLAGIYDLNSEFYRLRGSGLFLNSAFGIGTEFSQGGIEGPSIFPRTSAGVRIAVKPTPTTVLRFALLDGVPLVRPDGSRALFKGGDGLLGVAEAAFLTRPEDASTDRSGTRDRIGRFSSVPPYGDKLAVGAWYFSGRFPLVEAGSADTTPALQRGNSGLYVVGEGSLLPAQHDSAKQLAAFFQAGIADPRTNRFAQRLAAGLVGSGLAGVRAADQAGIAVTRTINGADYRRAQLSQGTATWLAETTVEFFYLAQLSNHLTLQPDLQYVRHPNTNPAIADAWVLQVHFQLSF